ncbi:Mediator of RNA polymerase II transcription subunit 37f [Zea mays]|uniref:Mediator of RNA polymerase II transcription subunit 37f n=1 Tax=Zea mays TaxID=4577 RepID=A0A3L6G6W9_MAIZE|nr:Mediator of RNA polymerase II transcription subunit 37f [Zea mays]
MDTMMGRRLLVSLVPLLMAVMVAAAFDISRGTPAFEVRRGAPKEYCDWRRPWGATPFLLGSAAAIHLGNTNSCIAAYDFRPGSHEYYQLCMPSWVAITDNDTVLSGEAAMNHATVSPRTAISGFTCLLDQKLTDDVVKSEMKLSPPYKFSERPAWPSHRVLPVDLTVVLVSELKHRAEAHLGPELLATVIAVPRHLNYNERHDIINVGRHDAGFHRGAKAIDRQIVAAVAYHHHTKQGDDFTAWIVDYMAELRKEKHQWDIMQDAEALRRLRVACEHAKKALSDQEETMVQIHVAGIESLAPLTQAKLEELNQDLLDRVMGLVDEAVMGTGWLPRPRDESHKDMVDEIVLVGGGTRMPKLRQLVEDYFHGRRRNSRKGVEPEDTIVRGTAILSRPKAARYLEECFDYLYDKDGRGLPSFIFRMPD